MGELSWWHWLIVIAALMLLFGANKLPQMARSLGQSVRILRSETRAMGDDKDKERKDTSATTAQQSLESADRNSASVSSANAEQQKPAQA
jgi:sec-independent protein translocase protein TatA